jgi:hypothetical protein
MTTITFERTGGFMGKPVNLKIDLDTLPDDQAQKLQNLLLTSDFFEIPENTPAAASAARSPGRDEFNYHVTVEANRSRHTVHTTDATAPANLRPLIEELSRLAKVQSK